MLNYISEHQIISTIIALFLINILGKMITKKRTGPISYLFFSIFSFLFGSCSLLGDKVSETNGNYYYSVDGKQIFFCPMGNWFELGKRSMDVDLESFRVLSDYYWARDTNYIYFENTRLDYLDIDLNSFQINDFLWTSDKNHVYVINYHGESDEPVIVVADADPQTYVNLDDSGWAKDKNYLFYENKKTEIDPDLFQKLNYSFVRDQKHVYLMPNSTEKDGFIYFQKMDVDVNQVISMDDYLIRDDKMLYQFCYNHKGESLMKIISIPFDSLDDLDFEKGRYFRVKDKIYMEGFELKGADAATFKSLKDGYFRDKNHLYFWDIRIEGADFETLVYREDIHSYEDKNWRYMREMKKPKEEEKKERK